jgi:hypothetical protein
MKTELDTFNKLKYDGNWYPSVFNCLSDMSNLFDEVVSKLYIAKNLSEDGLLEVWIYNYKPIYIRDTKLAPLGSGRHHCLATSMTEFQQIYHSDIEFWKQFYNRL